MTVVVVPLSTRRATLSLGRRLASHVRGGDLILLEGALGTGKTFLSRAIARGLGVLREVTVASPTFALVHEYEARLKLVHADLYRLTEASSVRELGLLEARDDGAVIVAEWAERFASELGSDGLVVTMTRTGDTRSATLSPRGPRGLELMHAAIGTHA